MANSSIITISLAKENMDLVNMIMESTKETKRSKAMATIFRSLKDKTAQIIRYQKNEAIYKAIIKAYQDVKPDDIEYLIQQLEAI